MSLTNEQLSNAPAGMLDAQRDDLDKTIEVLEESKDDLKEKEWVDECFDVVIEAMKEKRAMH